MSSLESTREFISVLNVSLASRFGGLLMYLARVLTFDWSDEFCDLRFLTSSISSLFWLDTEFICVWSESIWSLLRVVVVEVPTERSSWEICNGFIHALCFVGGGGAVYVLFWVFQAVALCKVRVSDFLGILRGRRPSECMSR